MMILRVVNLPLCIIGFQFIGPSACFSPLQQQHSRIQVIISTPQTGCTFFERAPQYARRQLLFMSSDNDNEQNKPDSSDEGGMSSADESAAAELLSRREKMKKRVKIMAKRLANPMPRAIASVLSDATLGAMDMAVEEVMSRSPAASSSVASGLSSSSSSTAVKKISNQSTPTEMADKTNIPDDNDTSSLSELTSDLVNEAFEPMELALDELEDSLKNARSALVTAKSQASQAIEAIQAAAIAQAEGAATIVQTAEEDAERKVINEIYDSADGSEVVDVAGLSLEDVNFEDSEMMPPFLDEASCLIPGEPVVRVEKAPENSRRIFAGVDIMASVDDVWNVLTDYGNLQNVIPNLVVNEVLDIYDGLTDYSKVDIDASASDQNQCKEMAEQMKGSLLKQVGGAKVVGINFSARTTLEVREWPEGLPDFAHYQDEFWDGKSRDERANEYSQTKLERYIFPRPFAISSLPTKDISMQSIGGDDGEFRLYQGVWRMQPLPGCAAPGSSAMRLTYAVEISPRAYLPVQLVEGRIVKDLCNNLIAIRDAVTPDP